MFSLSCPCSSLVQIDPASLLLKISDNFGQKMFPRTERSRNLVYPLAGVGIVFFFPAQTVVSVADRANPKSCFNDRRNEGRNILFSQSLTEKELSEISQL